MPAPPQVVLLWPVRGISRSRLVDAGGICCPLGAALSTGEVLSVLPPTPNHGLCCSESFQGFVSVSCRGFTGLVRNKNVSFPSCAES